MKEILRKYYGIEAIEVKKLVGYENVNYQIKTPERKYIFKTYKMDEDLFDLVKAESGLLAHLSDPGNHHFPKPIKTLDGDYVIKTEIDGDDLVIRLLSFLEGTFFAEADHTSSLFESFGTFLAKMDLQLQQYRNYTIQARQFEWDIQYATLNAPLISDIPEPENRKIIAYFFQQFKELIHPILPKLRKSIIHNDANDWNVLVAGNQISGIIDFGDVVYSPLINELAVAISYAIMEKDDPISWACHIINGYHKILPLETIEVDALYYLIATQLCISVSNSAHNKKKNPDNRYISINEKPAWRLLHHWISINPIRAKETFRKTVGLSTEKSMPIDEIIRNRHKYIPPIISLSYSLPIYMNRAAFQYMYDGYGNTFLDAYNNIPHVGHEHPKVVEAGQKQMAILNTNTRYAYDLLNEYADRLLAKFHPGLNKVYFVNSGSAACDLAIRLARHHSGFSNIMVMEHGYHGHTQTGIDISDYKFSNVKGQGQKPYILKAPIPDTHNGKYNDENAGFKYAKEAIELLKEYKNPVAAFITEPILGCAGQVPLAPGYLKNLYPEIRNQGGVCISDEVQTGFGRLGEYFWGYEAQDVIPDIVILGKPMGNGHPIGAVITTDEIADSFNKGVEFFSSFGGNPVSCAIGLAVLDVIEEEGLQQNAMEVGNHYKYLLNDLKNDFNCIGDVRGFGLFLGVEIVNKDQKPDTRLAGIIKNELRNRNILISTDGPFDNVLKSKPPLCFTKADAEKVVQHIYEILIKHDRQ